MLQRQAALVEVAVLVVSVRFDAALPLALFSLEILLLLGMKGRHFKAA
jgi:hypothetical protein